MTLATFLSSLSNASLHLCASHDAARSSRDSVATFSTSYRLVDDVRANMAQYNLVCPGVGLPWVMRSLIAQTSGPVVTETLAPKTIGSSTFEPIAWELMDLNADDAFAWRSISSTVPRRLG